jgi:hypothetical protein
MNDIPDMIGPIHADWISVGFRILILSKDEMRDWDNPSDKKVVAAGGLVVPDTGTMGSSVKVEGGMRDEYTPAEMRDGGASGGEVDILRARLAPLLMLLTDVDDDPSPEDSPSA